MEIPRDRQLSIAYELLRKSILNYWNDVKDSQSWRDESIESLKIERKEFEAFLGINFEWHNMKILKHFFKEGRLPDIIQPENYERMLAHSHRKFIKKKYGKHLQGWKNIIEKIANKIYLDPISSPYTMNRLSKAHIAGYHYNSNCYTKDFKSAQLLSEDLKAFAEEVIKTLQE